jgi:hypothetical protein
MLKLASKHVSIMVYGTYNNNPHHKLNKVRFDSYLTFGFHHTSN